MAQCNESARSMERMEEMLILSNRLDFREVSRAVPLISASRWLVRRGEVTRVWWKEGASGNAAETAAAKLTFGRRAAVNRQQLHLFLFTDLLVVARRKSEDNFVVFDHCPRNLVTLAGLDAAELSCLPGFIGGKGAKADGNAAQSSSSSSSSASVTTSSSSSSSAPSNAASPSSSSSTSAVANPQTSSSSNFAWLTLLQSHENKTVEWLISFR